MLINSFIINQLLKVQQLKAAIIPNASVAHKGPLRAGLALALAMPRLPVPTVFTISTDYLIPITVCCRCRV
jgi:hypothetical protein